MKAELQAIVTVLSLVNPAICAMMSMFGTANLDVRSVWINYEVSLFIYESEFSRDLAALQRTYLEDSEHLDSAAWGARSFRERFLENAIRLVSPIL
ncbi:MAG: hypothetical protein ABGZ53_10690 [Fuerstiella sp.]